MFTSNSTTGLFAGVMALVLAMPAVAGEVDLSQAEANAADLPMVMAASTTAGPVLDRSSLGPMGRPAPSQQPVAAVAAAPPAAPQQVDVQGAVEPTRSISNLQALRKARAARAARVYSSNGNGYRGTQLILGVRF
jgi:hypothetical protein